MTKKIATMKLIVETAAVLFVCFTNVLGQEGLFTESPRCTLIVKTDNNEIVDVWINKRLVGKTPLKIDTIKAGFYDISFLNPIIRDSILNTPIQSSKDYSYVPVISSFQNELTSGGSSSISMASAELARESNVKTNVPANQSTVVVFKIGQAKDYMSSEEKKGKLKVLLGVLLGAAVIGTSLYFIFKNISDVP